MFFSDRRLPTPRFSLVWLFGLTTVASLDLALIRIGAGMIGLAFTLALLLCLDFKTEKYRFALAGICLVAHAILMAPSNGGH